MAEYFHEVRTSIPPYGVCALCEANRLDVCQGGFSSQGSVQGCGSPVATSAAGRSTDRGDSRDACPDRRSRGIFVASSVQGVPCALAGYPNSLKPSTLQAVFLCQKEEI